jgi:tRNA(adenine34) deaminase
MNKKFMEEAIKLSEKALKNGEMPVGAVVVYENKIIGKGYNKKEKYNDSTMHAEIIAIRKASKCIKDWRLNKCSMYVTMEPCTMCIGAIIESRIPEIFCGIKNNKTNLVNKNLIKDNNIIMKYGIFEDEITKITEKFFKTIRNR